jgi:hypothetical protein
MQQHPHSELNIPLLRPYYGRGLCITYLRLRMRNQRHLYVFDFYTSETSNPIRNCLSWECSRCSAALIHSSWNVSLNLCSLCAIGRTGSPGVIRRAGSRLCMFPKSQTNERQSSQGRMDPLFCARRRVPNRRVAHRELWDGLRFRAGDRLPGTFARFTKVAITSAHRAAPSRSR